VKIVGSRASLRGPSESSVVLVRVEDGGDCDGSLCGSMRFSSDGEPELPDPHHHLVISGRAPEAGPRWFPI